MIFDERDYFNDNDDQYDDIVVYDEDEDEYWDCDEDFHRYEDEDEFTRDFWYND